MKKLLIILLSILSQATHGQENKSLADSFIVAKTDPTFTRLLQFDTMRVGYPFEKSGPKKTIQRFRYLLTMPDGQALYYKVRGSRMATFEIDLCIDQTGIDITEDDLPTAKQAKKLERIFETHLISERDALDSADQYLYTDNIKSKKSLLIHDFNIDSTYWMIEIDTGKRKMLKQQVYIDAMTNRYMKTESMRYMHIPEEDFLSSRDETTFPFHPNCFGCPEDSSDFNAIIVPDYFLLGTLSDYTGRFRYIERETQIDRYYPHEEPLLKYINSFIKEYYKINTDTIFATSRHGDIYAKDLAPKLNEYYTKDGRLLDSIFKTEEQVYSFLLGNYYRYGQKISDKIYKIQIVNSTKDQQLYPMLKRIHCDKILYKLLRGYIPTSDIFYFEATPKLIRYFNIIEIEKQKLSDSYKTDLLSGEYGKKFWRYEKNKEKKERKELERVFSSYIEK